MLKLLIAKVCPMSTSELCQSYSYAVSNTRSALPLLSPLSADLHICTMRNASLHNVHLRICTMYICASAQCTSAQCAMQICSTHICTMYMCASAQCKSAQPFIYHARQRQCTLPPLKLPDFSLWFWWQKVVSTAILMQSLDSHFPALSIDPKRNLALHCCMRR